MVMWMDLQLVLMLDNETVILLASPMEQMMDVWKDDEMVSL